MRLTAISCALLLAALAGPAATAADLVFVNHENIPGFRAGFGELDAVFHDGILHVVSTSNGRQIVHTQRHEGQWTAPTTLAHHRSGTTPVLAVCEGVLHMVANPGDFKLAHSIWDGRAWGEPQDIPDMRASRRGSLVGFAGALHLAHNGKNNDSHPVYYSSNAGWGWGHNVALPDQRSRSTVAMAGLGETLHMVYAGKNSPTLWHTTRDRWGEWTAPVQVPGVVTDRIPELVAVAGRLYAFYTVGDLRPNTQAPVGYCVFEDGRWQQPVVVEGYVCYANPAVAVEPGLPQQIHLFLPNPTGVLHLQTEGEATMAPLQMKPVQRVR